MSVHVHRRDLLATLVALTAGSALPAVARAADPAAAFDDLDKAAVARIGQAWLALHPGINARALAASLFPKGSGADNLTDLRKRAAADFRRGAVFTHRGWRLSDTEGALFGLLALQGG